MGIASRQSTLERLIAASSDAMLVTDLNDVVLHANIAAERLFRRAPGTMVGGAVTLPQGDETLFGAEISCDDGSVCSVKLKATPIRWHDADAVLVTLHDLTAERQQTAELYRLASAIEQCSDSIVITQPDGAIVFVNAKFEKITGYAAEEAIGRNPRFMQGGKHPQPFYEELWRTLNDQQTWTGRFINRRPDGEEYLLDAIISPVVGASGQTQSYVLVGRDVTLEVQLQAQLEQQQRLESIGVLASGVAHEINNPVNGIMNYAQLILDGLDEADVKEFAGEIIHESERISRIVKDLLAFSRHEKKRYSPARVSDLVAGTLSLVQTVMRHDQVTLTIDIDEDLPEVCCRTQQIQQVLMNLLTNARDALKERFAEYSEDKQIKVVGSQLFDPMGDWVRLSVTDRGPGIPPEVRECVFQPFFTTKDRSRGTGLGLSICMRIVQEHNGRLLFESEPGCGTTFHIDLPQRGTPDYARGGGSA
jgi:PAS domain S-box-containing protein